MRAALNNEYKYARFSFHNAQPLPRNALIRNEHDKCVQLRTVNILFFLFSFLFPARFNERIIFIPSIIYFRTMLCSQQRYLIISPLFSLFLHSSISHFLLRFFFPIKLCAVAIWTILSSALVCRRYRRILCLHNSNVRETYILLLYMCVCADIVIVYHSLLLFAVKFTIFFFTIFLIIRSTFSVSLCVCVCRMGLLDIVSNYYLFCVNMKYTRPWIHHSVAMVKNCL